MAQSDVPHDAEKMNDPLEMSMSMSVQSAWDDLVVENPNRAKLEGCLLITIMLVVGCIIALLVYVFIKMEPQGDVILRPPYWKTQFYDDPLNRQFAIRMMGWINWTATRCKGFSQWACGGRVIEASSLAISETAESVAEDYAMEYVIELIEGRRHINKLEANENRYHFDNDERDFRVMHKWFPQCRKGMKTKEEFAEALKKAWNDSWTAKPYMVPESEAGHVYDALRDFSKLYFFPLGHASWERISDNYTSPRVITVFPPRFLGRAIDIGNPRYRATVVYGYKVVASFLKGSCCLDDGGRIYDLEVGLMKDLENIDEDYIDIGEQETKLNKNEEDICKTVYNGSNCRFLHTAARRAFGKVLKAKGNLFMNWALLKFIILLSPFLPSDDPTLVPFYNLVAMYHRRAEMPHKDILCMHLLERYFRETIFRIYDRTDHIKELADTINSSVSKLNDTLGHTGSPGKSGKPITIVSTLLDYPGSPFTSSMRKHPNISYIFRIPHFRFMRPPEAVGPYAQFSEREPLVVIFYIGKFIAHHMPEYGLQDEIRWVGPVFGAEPFLDMFHDRIFVPLGVAMPPYYHPDTAHIKHSLPGFLTKIMKPVVKRYVSLLLSLKRLSKNNSMRLHHASLYLRNISSRDIEAFASYVYKQVKCFKKAYGPDMMWDLFYEKSAVQLVYRMWRLMYNHKTVNMDTQLRLGYIKFISEEMIFFITAANGLCYTANPKFASKKEQELAPKRVNSVLYSKLLGQSMLCSEKREVYKPPCRGLFQELERVDEGLWTVERWRNAKKVILE